MRRVSRWGLVAYVPRGPLLLPDQAHVAQPLYLHLNQLVQAQQIQYLNIQPACQSGSFVEQLLADGFQPSQIHVAPPATALLDLTPPLEAIWAKIKKKRRKAIRYAAGKELSVRQGGWEDLDAFYALLTQLAHRRMGKIYPKAYYENMWRVLNQQGYLRLFILEYQGKPVTMHWVIPFGHTLVSKLAAWSGNEAELHPNELLEWAVIQWAKAQGYHYYDFEGIHPAAAKALLAQQPLPSFLAQSATSFKLSFGGHPILLPQALDRVFNPVLQWLYQAVFQRTAEWPWTKKMINHFRTHHG
jgi:hypothetical protein